MIYCNSNRARVRPNFSRFKKCNAMGSENKICPFELRQSSMLFFGASDLFQRLLTSCSRHLFSTTLIFVHISSTLLNSLFMSLFSSQLLSIRVGSPHCSSTSLQFHLSIVSQPSGIDTC